MIRGFYTAASGIVTQEKKLNSVANNIANVSTTGYKRDDIVMGTFGEHLSLRRNAYQNAGFADIGPGVYMQVVDGKYTDHTQGGFETTTRPLDMAIMGDGYFVVNTYEGEELLTRDGQFSLDDEGYLVLPGFGRVQGENGNILLGQSDIWVDGYGNIYLSDEEGEREAVDRLQIALPEDPATMTKVRDSLWTAENYAILNPEGEGEMPLIRQRSLERSNVNMSDEMTKMIASQRQLQSCSQLVKMYDELSGQINSQVSKV